MPEHTRQNKSTMLKWKYNNTKQCINQVKKCTQHQITVLNALVFIPWPSKGYLLWNGSFATHLKFPKDDWQIWGLIMFCCLKKLKILLSVPLWNVLDNLEDNPNVHNGLTSWEIENLSDIPTLRYSKERMRPVSEVGYKVRN